MKDSTSLSHLHGLLDAHNQETLMVVDAWAILLPPVQLYVNQEPTVIIHKLAEVSSTLYMT